jgi:hypothetical protein
MENVSNKMQKPFKNHDFLGCGRIYKARISAAAANRTC